MQIWYRRKNQLLQLFILLLEILPHQLSKQRCERDTIIE